MSNINDLVTKHESLKRQLGSEFVQQIESSNNRYTNIGAVIGSAVGTIGGAMLKYSLGPFDNTTYDLVSGGFVCGILGLPLGILLGKMYCKYNACRQFPDKVKRIEELAKVTDEQIGAKVTEALDD